VTRRRAIPVKPLLVLAGVFAAIRVALFLGPSLPFASPAGVAAALFLYAPLPHYLRRGTPSWVSVTGPGRSFRTALLLAAAGAAAFILFVRLPLPPSISPYRATTTPLSATLVAHLLFLVALPEELFFRGYLYDAFEEAGWEPVLPTALLFAAGHVALGATPIRAMTFFPGLLLGWGRKRSGNIYVPLAVHFIYNLYPSLIGGPA
jgi:membrane protease YdiL (CAAX protease family)